MDSKAGHSSRIERAYRVRAYPNRLQKRKFRRLFGAARAVWNWALGVRKEAWESRQESINWVGLSRLFTQYRQAEETRWLSELPRAPFIQVLRDLERAYQNFFAKRARFPRFKRRGSVNRLRFTLDQRRLQVDRMNGLVHLDGIGKVRFVNTYDEMPGRLRSVTVSLDAAGRWHLCFTADEVDVPRTTSSTLESVGVDIGLYHLVVSSEGRKTDAPKTLNKKLYRLRRYQRRATRQRNEMLRIIGLDPKKPVPRGTRIPVSKRANCTRQKIGKLHVRIADQRRACLHQISHDLVEKHGVICLEHLNIKDMAGGMERRAWRRSLHDASIGELLRQIEYKARWLHRTVVKVGKYFPSTQYCSVCLHQKTDITLNDRVWTCPKCSTEHDRDINAAKNILREGLRLLAATPGSGGSKARGEDHAGVATVVAMSEPTSVKRERIKKGALRRAFIEPVWNGRR